MSTLAEIERAAAALPPEQQQELIRFLTRQREQGNARRKARLVVQGGDVLLEAPPGAPAMTPEHVKRMLEDWP